MTPIPFMLPDIGLREIAGSIYLTDRFIVIDIENALLGAFDKDRSTIEVEPGALAEVRLEKGLFKDRIILRPNGLELLEAIPGDNTSEAALVIWKIYRKRTQVLVEEARRRVRSDAESG